MTRTGLSQLLRTRCVVAAAGALLALGTISTLSPGSDARATPITTPRTATWHAPQLIEPVSGLLNAVSCPTTTFCAATDQRGNILTYDGATWSAPLRLELGVSAFAYGVTIPSPMYAVSCSSTTFCLASGDRGVFRFDGTAWSLLSGSGAPGEMLRAVDCVSATFCMGVGNDLSWVFNGTSWRSFSFAGHFGREYAVTCGTSKLCLTYDYVYNHVLAFNGRGWHVVNGFDGDRASCVTATYCVALSLSGVSAVFDGVGWSDEAALPFEEFRATIECPATASCVLLNGDGNYALWNGTAWSSSQPDPITQADGFSCATPTRCTAVVGDTAASFDGTSWTAGVVDPSIGGLLTDVSCGTPASCFTVDDVGGAARWNGVSWTAPVAIDPGRALTSVSCVGTTFCIAVDDVGQYVEWSGVRWTRPKPAAHRGRASILDVSCASSTFCLEVARYATHRGSTQELRRWDGQVWTTVTDPAVVYAAAVSCVPSSVCTMIDHAKSQSTADGVSWTDPVSFTGAPKNLSCASATFCAVSTEPYGKVARFDGTSWTAPAAVDDQIPTDSPFQPPLTVACAAPTFCTAVDTEGYSVTTFGHAWTAPVLADPPSATAPSRIYGIDCPTAGFCMAIDGNGAVLVRS